MGVKMSWGNSLRSFDNLVERTVKDVEKDIQKLVDKTSTTVESKVKQLTPVKTGKLKNSWTKRRTKRGKQRIITISNTQSYAKYVEYGTRSKMPKRMLSKSVAIGSRHMKKGLKQIGNKTQRNFR